MQLNHASGTINALPRQIAARMFCVMLTYVTLRGRLSDDGCLCSGQDYRQRRPSCLISSDSDGRTETTESDAHFAVGRYKSEPEEVDQDTCLLQ